MIDQLFMQDLARDLAPPLEPVEQPATLLAAGPATSDVGQVTVQGYNESKPSGVRVGRAGISPEQSAKAGGLDRPLVALLDTLAGALKGATAQTLGLPGDIRSILDLISKEGAQKYLGDPVMPTTEQMQDILPAVVPQGVANQADREYTAKMASEIGTFLPAPGIPEAAVQGVKAVTKAVKATKGLPVGMSIQDVTPKMGAVKPGDELIVQHNLTAENLIKADKLGGLPVPSLAISKAANPMSDKFGEITLIGGQEMANPSAKNPVFGSDAYTKRFPSIDYQIDQKSTNALKSMFSDVINKMPEGKNYFDRFIDNWEDREYSDLLKAKYVSEVAELPTTQNKYDFNEQVNKIVYDNSAAYREWISNFDDSLPDQGVNIKEKIFKGYTNNGRRYAEANLENIVKEMKGGAGQENWDYGAASLRAKITPKFRTFSQVKAGRDKIVGVEEFDKLKESSNERYSELLDRLSKVNNKYSPSDAIAEVAETRSINALDRNYPEIPQNLKADIASFLDTLKSMPTEYFEVKPQRAVGIGEFRGAIIPKDTPKKARDILKRNGIVEVYEYTTPEERKSLFQKYKKEMFSVAPAIPAAATQQEENK